jgi:phenylpropionate dioxygenase-like ring-hydroxylating dioxygenase large terminal subunit
MDIAPTPAQRVPPQFVPPAGSLDLLVSATTAGLAEDAPHAATLPPEAYTSQAFYDLEIERIFKQDWFSLGHIAQIPNVGDYFTFDYLNELLVIVRGEDRVRVMSRICLHRWAPVATGCGNAKRFSCPFHKWTYDLDGQLLGAPLMDEAADFDAKDWKLPELRSEVVDGIIFATLSPSIDSIGERLAGWSAKMAPHRLADLKIGYSFEVILNFNWKIAAETFAECYHHIGAHRETLEPRYPATLSWCEGARGQGWTECHQDLRPNMPAEGGNVIGLPLLPGIADMNKTGFDMYILFPATLVSINRERLNVTALTPLGPNKTRWSRHVMVSPECLDLPDYEEKIAALKGKGDAIFQEDIAVNEMQQIGAASSLAPIGRLSHLEHTVWYLANYVREKMA